MGGDADDGAGSGASAAKPKVLMLGEVYFAHEYYAEMAKVVEFVKPRSNDREVFIADCKAGLYDGVVAAHRTYQTVHMDEEVVNALPASLRSIAHTGAGYDQVNINACTARNIRVSNVPHAVDDPTADTAIFLMLGALRRFWKPMTTLRAGRWRIIDAITDVGNNPEGKVLGILGMGGIGRNMARKASRAFGMRIKYHNRTCLAPEVEAECGGAEYVSFDELLAESDVLSICLPLNSQTRHIIGKAEFAKMKPGVCIVNTARGAIIDEPALIAALEDGTVRSAGLDVFENEPNVDRRLLAMQNVILLPHFGTSTHESLLEMEEIALSNVRRSALEGKMVTIVPEQKKLGWE